MRRFWSARTFVHLTLISAGLTAMIASGAAQGGGATVAPPGDASGNATGGKVTFLDTTGMRVSRLRFEAGARTKWHVHTAPQLLLVEEGKGRLQEQGSKVRDLLLGQPVYTKANVPHWHGAAPDQPSVQFTFYGGTIEWKDAVTDEQYRGKAGR
jgi:quercetin dioxygenase-like cupin family protein